MKPDSAHVPKRSLTDTLFVLFLRIVAISCLWLGIQYWSMLVGYSLQGHARFDLLSVPWRVAASSLAGGFPVAALGLWVAGSWGPVIWIVTAGAQGLMHGVWPEIFGRYALVVPMHLLVALVYIVFRVALWLEKRHKAQEITVDLP
ncbi:hypothetical protein HGO38_10530 [Rhizobium sp. CG5]|uniref:DUF6163 family protein n=1 Tax=Rhizobium sp. CG5 TaxID=2726076 RepID=UPI0020341E0D|nr:DUF6163 family protein [Rhizobium sp. CG5]MCM2473907.1 hypothetical protein [Rhizobium sp. CG5]